MGNEICFGETYIRYLLKVALKTQKCRPRQFLKPYLNPLYNDQNRYKYNFAKKRPCVKCHKNGFKRLPSLSSV